MSSKSPNSKQGTTIDGGINEREFMEKIGVEREGGEKPERMREKNNTKRIL